MESTITLLTIALALTAAYGFMITKSRNKSNDKYNCLKATMSQREVNLFKLTELHNCVVKFEMFLHKAKNVEDIKQEFENIFKAE